MKKIITFFILALLVISCNTDQNDKILNEDDKDTLTEIQKKLNEYVNVKLTVNLNHLSEQEKQIIPMLIDVCKIINEIYWYETLGNKDTLCKDFSNKAIKKLFEINFGPWDRLRNNEPFIKCLDPKPLGANFYPKDMSKNEFEKFEDKTKTSPFTIIRRNEKGNLQSIPYNKAFSELVMRASILLKQAANLVEDDSLKYYLELRAEALTTDNYKESDMAWMSVKNNTLDFIVGPIEINDDKLFGYKAEHMAFLLIKDKEWSQKLEKYTKMLRYLQKALPVPVEYRHEEPGLNSEINVYDVIYYAGAGIAGGVTIATNYPTNPTVQLEKGSRRAQFKNAIKAKFDNILIPIADVLIDKSYRKHINFDAFFNNIMLHEMAVGLGIRNTLNKNMSVKKALKENSEILNEVKAEVLALFFAQKLHSINEIENDLTENYITFLASTLRSIRLGVTGKDGMASLICFNYMIEKKAFIRNNEGEYLINTTNIKLAIDMLSELIIRIQGDGDYQKAKELLQNYGKIGTILENDLLKLHNNSIPIDIYLEQGLEVLDI